MFNCSLIVKVYEIKGGPRREQKRGDERGTKNLYEAQNSNSIEGIISATFSEGSANGIENSSIQLQDGIVTCARVD